MNASVAGEVNSILRNWGRAGRFDRRVAERSATVARTTPRVAKQWGGKGLAGRSTGIGALRPLLRPSIIFPVSPDTFFDFSRVVF
jgi:hypothetical protein